MDFSIRHVPDKGMHENRGFALSDEGRRGSNHCLVGAAVDRRAGRLVVVSAIDNLVKGASGQAIQALNVVLGLPETMGLEQPPLYP